MKVIIANDPVINIATTLKMESVLPSSIAAFKGFSNPISAIKVMKTAMCAIILFSLFTPPLHNNNTTPKNNGINAVID